MLVSLDTCGEGGKLWDQGPKMRVWASYSFLKNVSYVCPSASVSTLLSARFYISGPLSFSSHLYSVLLLCNRPPQIEGRVHYRLRTQGHILPWWGSERLCERRCPETTSRLSWLTSHSGSNSPRGKFRHQPRWSLTAHSPAPQHCDLGQFTSPFWAPVTKAFKWGGLCSTCLLCAPSLDESYFMALECRVLALFLRYPSFLGEAASCEDSVTRERQQHDFGCSTGTGDLVWACAIGSLVSGFHFVWMYSSTALYHLYPPGHPSSSTAKTW